jgi:hypothetical protein
MLEIRSPGLDSRPRNVGFVEEKWQLSEFSSSTSVSPTNFHATFINHLIIRRCLVSILTASLHNQNKEDAYPVTSRHVTPEIGHQSCPLNSCDRGAVLGG